MEGFTIGRRKALNRTIDVLSDLFDFFVDSRIEPLSFSFVKIENNSELIDSVRQFLILFSTAIAIFESCCVFFNPRTLLI